MFPPNINPVFYHMFREDWSAHLMSRINRRIAANRRSRWSADDFEIVGRYSGSRGKDMFYDCSLIKSGDPRGDDLKWVLHNFCYPAIDCLANGLVTGGPVHIGDGRQFGVLNGYDMGKYRRYYSGPIPVQLSIDYDHLNDGHRITFILFAWHVDQQRIQWEIDGKRVFHCRAHSTFDGEANPFVLDEYDQLRRRLGFENLSPVSKFPFPRNVPVES